MRFLVLAALVASSAPAHACPMKSNELVIVLGVAGGEPVTLRLSISEDGKMTSEWRGRAALEHGTRALWSDTIASAENIDGELARVIARARVDARALRGFVPAVRTAVADCTDRPRMRCGAVHLAGKGTALRVGSTTHALAMPPRLSNLTPEDLALTGVVTYRAGRRTFTVVNVGSGDPKFSTLVRLCEDKRCRDITTLHHGEQADVVIDG